MRREEKKKDIGVNKYKELEEKEDRKRGEGRYSEMTKKVG